MSPPGLDNAIDAFLEDPASADDATVAAINAFDQRLPALRSALRASDTEIFAALVAARDTLAADPGAAASAPETPNLETAALEWTAFTRLIDGEEDFDTSIFTDSATTEDALTLEMTTSLREAVAVQGASLSSLLTSPKVTPELLVAGAGFRGRREVTSRPVEVRIGGLHLAGAEQRWSGDLQPHRGERRRGTRRAGRRGAHGQRHDRAAGIPLGRSAVDRCGRRAVR